ncbi:hypothetical protein OPU71_20605 [Niveibacterium sp. 24ML]|uniref:hypothetical protein n=1 Tax=Niveibacterium sp. 24ML TaxID=2985512 RepID=UPI0022719431|nr:hypothetical protein [Niveibacterium sp. 24ML]MCX9158531.1 hypothetical protein [Niveibacterium sp. 24ML]
MSLLKAFEAGVGSVVIIDDLYLEPNPEAVNGEALAALHRELKASPENCTQLGTLLNTAEVDAFKLLDVVNDNLAQLYDKHITGHHPLLQTLFSDLDEKKTAGLRRLRALEAEIAKFFDVTPKTFGSLDASREDLSACSIAFVDFFLEGITNHEEARKNHQAVKTELGKAVPVGKDMFPKVVVLMSTSLPDSGELAIFRKETSVRGAFFHTMDKANFSSAEIEARLKYFQASYESAIKLNGYLETIEKEISSAASELNAELRNRLDVHDLTILKTLRLDAESDTPQSYLTQLLAEALAARVRMAKGLQESVLPTEHSYGDAPFDGKLLPSSVLFELFADIAVAPTPTSGTAKVAFGDVLEFVDETQKGKLLLAISPACDLQRSSADYEVLLVPGKVVESNASLSTLIHNSYGFGQGGLVLRLPAAGGEASYSNIVFDYKSLRTLPVSVLQDSKRHRRIARLTEIFAQEIKTLALNNASRVGVPIDPSFSIGLKAKVRYRFCGDGRDAPSVEGEFDADGAGFYPAVLAMGRQLGDSELYFTVMFSLQFKEQLQKTLEEKLAQQSSNKLKVVAEHFAKPDNFKVVFDGGSKSKSFNGGITIRYSRTLGQLAQPKNFEILLYSEVEEDKQPEAADGGGFAS